MQQLQQFLSFVHEGVVPDRRRSTSQWRWNTFFIGVIVCCIAAAISVVSASSPASASSAAIPIPIPVHHWSRYFTAPAYTRLPLIRGAMDTLGEGASDLDTVLKFVTHRRTPRPRALFSPRVDGSGGDQSSSSTSSPLPVRKRVRARPLRTPRRANSTSRHRLHSMTSNVANGSPLVGCASLDFSIPVLLGATGSKVFQLLFDTGSSTLAVAGSTCSTCTSAGVSPTYKASGTSAGTTSSSYGDGSGWSGTVYSDTVKVAGSTSNNGITPAVSMKLASITKQDNSFFYAGTCSDFNSNSSPWQGIIGFAYESLAVGNTDSFPYKLIQQTAGTASPYANEFYVEMCINDGALWFSGMSLNSYSGQFNYVPISDESYYQVVVSSLKIGSAVVDSSLSSVQSIVDSGTSMLSLPSSTYNAAIAKINSNSKFANWFGSQFWTSGFCANTPNGETIATMSAGLPTLSIQFGNGVVATLPAIGSYIIPCDSTLTSWMPGITDSGDDFSMTLGWSFMNMFVVHHDIANARIGFAVATGCSPMYTSAGSGGLISGNPSGPTGTGVGGASGGGGGSASTAGANGSGSSGVGTATAAGSTGGSSSTTASASNSGNPTSGPSSATSSSGSSATGGTHSTTSGTTGAGGGSPADSATGGILSGVTIPTSLPFICTNFRFNSLPSPSSQYEIASNIAGDIAIATSVSTSRVLVVSVHNLDSSITQVRFTIADALVASQAASVDVATRYINEFSWAENPFTDKTSFPYLQYAVADGTGLCPSQSELTSLPIIQFGLSYSIDSLPGGSVTSFADQLRSSLASACSTTASRILVNSVVAGSVQVSFVVSDTNTKAHDISAQQAVNNFMGRVGSNNVQASSSILSQTMANSTTVSNVGAALIAAAEAGTASTTSSGSTTTIVIIAVAAGGGLIFIVAGTWIVYTYCFKSPSQVNHGTAKVMPHQNAMSYPGTTNGFVHPVAGHSYASSPAYQQGPHYYGPGAPTHAHGNVQVLVAPPVLMHVEQ